MDAHGGDAVWWGGPPALAFRRDLGDRASIASEIVEDQSAFTGDSNGGCLRKIRGEWSAE